jgi:endo-1,4-beta-xylanase
MTRISPKPALITLVRFAPAILACLLVSPAGATDLPINSNFDDGTTPWWTYASSGNTQTVAVSTDFRLCSVIDPTTNLDDKGDLKKVNPWDHIIGISDIAVTPEQYYHVSFTASFTPTDTAGDPNAKREIRFKTGLGEAPFTDYFVYKAQLTSTAQTFDFTLRNLREDAASQAQFQIGGVPGTVCLDNILIEAVPAPAPVTHVTPSTTGHALKDHVAMVKMGTAVDTPIFLSSPLHNALVAGEFSAITPANSMKMNLIQPTKGIFDYVDTDALVAYAAANGLEFRGHPLVWHTQTPDWLNNPETPFTQQEMIDIMNAHIDGLAGHYAGKFPYWDVVNEAIENVKVGTDPDVWMWTFRPTVWHKGIGDNFIDLAFQRAHMADPAAKLVYNDYNIEQKGNPKADKVFELVQGMKARGIPIDAIGFQSHYYVRPDGSTTEGIPNMQAIRDNMARYAEIGVEVHITECDFRIGKPTDDAKAKLQSDFFTGLLQACIDAPNCSHYTVWGASDLDSWVPSTFPEFDFAHIFDATLTAKPAYHALTQVFAQYNTDGTPLGGGGTAAKGGCAVAPGNAPERAPYYLGFLGLVGLSLVLRRASKLRAA